MENRTVTFKDMLRKLEELDIDKHLDVHEIFEKVPKELNECKVFVNDMKNAEVQFKNLFDGYIKKSADWSDDKIMDDVGVSRSEIKAARSKIDSKEHDFEEMVDFAKKVMEYERKKAPLFSEDRRNLEDAIKTLDKTKKGFSTFFNFMTIALDMIPGLIKKFQISNGDISDLVPMANAQIILSKDEKCYIRIDVVKLNEERSVRITTGGYGGFSFRVAKGVRANVGSFGASSESHLETRHTDTGTFYVTNKRYVFDGSKKNIQGELKKIISVETYADGVKISRGNTDELYVGAMDGHYVGAVISGMVKNIAEKSSRNISYNLNDLEQLAQLKEKGIITEEEFNAKKKQILGL